MTLSQEFKKRIKQRLPLVGTLQALPLPEITEMLITAGFEWIWVDMEHSTLDVSAMQRILQTAQPQCPCLVRVPSHDEVWFKKALDAGADGIIIPQIKTAKEVQHLMNFCKYPPIGNRSIGIARAHQYGTGFTDYVRNANDDIAVVLQIEHIDAVRNIESIIAVPGVDAVIIGPYDLSGSMNMTGKVNDPAVQQQIEHVRTVCHHANISLGIFTANPQDVPLLIEKKYSLIALGIDVMFLSQTLHNAFKQAVPGK